MSGAPVFGPFTATEYRVYLSELAALASCPELERERRARQYIARRRLANAECNPEARRKAVANRRFDQPSLSDDVLKEAVAKGMAALGLGWDDVKPPRGIHMERPQRGWLFTALRACGIQGLELARALGLSDSCVTNVGNANPAPAEVVARVVAAVGYLRGKEDRLRLEERTERGKARWARRRASTPRWLGLEMTRLAPEAVSQALQRAVAALGYQMADVVANREPGARYSQCRAYRQAATAEVLRRCGATLRETGEAIGIQECRVTKLLAQYRGELNPETIERVVGVVGWLRSEHDRRILGEASKRAKERWAKAHTSSTPRNVVDEAGKAA